MKATNLLALLALGCLLALPLSGCREEGPAERMGRGVDEAAEELEDAAEDLRDDLRRPR
jgi:hypothetical protein